MATDYICEGNKYRYKKGYIHLPLDIKGLPSHLNIENENLQLKTSLHVSLVCVKNLIDKYGEDIKQKVLDIFCRFTKENDVSFGGYRGEFRFANRAPDGRKTLVAMVNISNLDRFFEVTKNELNIEIEPQPTHVTLYTLGLNEGIGINGEDDLKKLTKDVTKQVPGNLRALLT